jgi:hypothetical protein
MNSGFGVSFGWVWGQGPTPRRWSEPDGDGCTTDCCPTANPACGPCCSTTRTAWSAPGRGRPTGPDRGTAGRGRPHHR